MEFPVLLIVVPCECILRLWRNTERENEDAVDLLDDSSFVSLELVRLGTAGRIGDVTTEREVVSSTCYCLVVGVYTYSTRAASRSLTVMSQLIREVALPLNESG